MNSNVCRGLSSITFWDIYAKWYDLWVEHTSYYNRIISTLMNMVQPGWRILDIGSGNGVLCWPLCAIGCDVTAIEPSAGMRKILHEKGLKRGIDWLRIKDTRWEDYQPSDNEDFDLVIACNSLQFTEIGFSQALRKVFSLKPANIFVVVEKNHVPNVPIIHDGYSLLFGRFYSTDTSFAYHSIGEFLQHFNLKRNILNTREELSEILEKLYYQNGHYWIKDNAVVCLYWWTKVS